MHRVLPFLLVWVALALVFGLLERKFPELPRPRPATGPSLRTDLTYWLFTPVVTRAVSEAAVVIAVTAVAVVLGHARDKAGVQAFVGHRTILARQPRALQVVELLLVADLCGYWVHRAFHARRLWPFHAVHHSSADLHWLSAARVHPINEVAGKLATVLPLLAFGFDLGATLAVAPLLTLYAIFLHANVRFDAGPLRYVIATPAFHRWHHTSQAEGMDKNFAGLFPFLDLLFGTFYMPRGRRPERFGVPELGMPEGLVGQLLFPFRRGRREE